MCHIGEIDIVWDTIYIPVQHILGRFRDTTNGDDTPKIELDYTTHVA
jgi:hypothetical protein